MTADDFRKLSLSFPETIESAHMGHPDFRVGGKIFATLTEDEDQGMAKLNAEQQAWFSRMHPSRSNLPPELGVNAVLRSFCSNLPTKL